MVELSIVLVILGLLVGGSLIRASDLHSVTTEYQRYYSATQAFKDKYSALPGDMTTATQIWGVVAVGVACVTTPSTDTKTCDGDGNGQIGSSATSDETMRFWQHLANAGIIEGQYDGVNNSLIEGPQSRIGIGWFVTYVGSITGSTLGFNGDYGNTYLLDAVMTPEEIWNIDTKMDDGKPAVGKVVVSGILPTFFSTCPDASGALAVQTANLNANYLLTSTAKCGIRFRNLF